MNRRLPDPSGPRPVPGGDVTYVKPTLTRPNIVVGDKWRDKPIEEIQSLILLLSSGEIPHG
jgi:hypothetical protein